ncbi:MAG: hypothetical protein ABH828_04900 [archaeon]
MARKTLERDAANAFSDAYTKAAPAYMMNLHNTLFDIADRVLSSIEGDKRFLIIGPGPQMLPFSRDRKRVKNMMGDGLIILQDYVFDTKRVAESVSGLTKLGFFDKGYFKIGECTDTEINPENLESGTINYLNSNLKSGIGIPDNSIDMIDATLVTHHVTPTLADLDRIVANYYNALENGGFLHFGTGNVDMKYSEQKINTLIGKLNNFLGEDVADEDKYVVIDQRNSSKTETTKDYPHGNNVVLDNQGMVHIKYSENLPGHLKTIGYNVVEINEEEVVIPLIDENLSEDRKGMMDPINEYYGMIQMNLEKGFEEGMIDEAVLDDKILSLNHEKRFASKGIVEYYTGKEDVLRSLRKTGFEIQSVTEYPNDVFYNILAMKNE